MKKLIGTVCASIAVGMALVSAPVAHAESGCVASGQTPEYCDHQYIDSINTVREQLGQSPLSYDEPGAISVLAAGHAVVNNTLKNPTKQGFVNAVNKVIADTAASNCPPPMSGCNPTRLTAEQAVFLVKVSILWLGPPGLREQIDQAMQS